MVEENDVSWKRIAALFHPHRRRVIYVVVVVVTSSVIGIANPLLVQAVFDRALFGADGVRLGLLVGLVVAMVTIALVSGGLGVLQTIETNRLGQTVLRDLRNRLYVHLQSQSLSFFSGARTGDLQSRLSSDVSNAQNAVTTTLSSILSNAITFASAVVAMLILSWQLTAVTLLVVPLFVLATRWVGARRKQYTREAQQHTAAMSVITQETLSVSGITLAKLFGQQQREIDRFQDASAQLADASQRQQVIGQTFFTMVQTFLGITPVVVYLAAGFAIDGGTDISAGTVVAFTTLQSRLFFPVARMLETVVELSSAKALFGRIFAYLDVEPEIVEERSAIELDRRAITGVVAFDHVGFAYPEADVAALEGIDFTAEPGQLIALVGPSGAGKSTVLQLVARLYDPQEGSVTIDGHDLRDLSFSSLANSVGFVTQESYLFAGSLRDNIAYGRSDATIDDIVEAARRAAIHDRILEFVDGYDTVVGERGTRLSGGERQRIAIARVLLADPRVLVLDEATSALDTASERRIQRALGELVSGRTTLAVAHRLSTIQAADTIHVVDRGQIVESGSHADLLARSGAYRALYDEQFDGGRVETRCSDGVVRSDGTVEYDHAEQRRLVRSTR